ncbi:MAG: penicillin-binding protein activator [Sphingobacteriia bacterium]|nr:penicillin-binding protein activator [Sphingobacteriia bacterium]
MFKKCLIILWIFTSFTGCKYTDNLLGKTVNKKVIIKKEEEFVGKFTVVALLPLTGSHDGTGKDIATGMKQAVKTLHSIDKEYKDINIKFFDSETELEKAISYINNNKIKIIYGPYFSKYTEQLRKNISKNTVIISFSNDEEIAKENVYIYGLHPKRYAEIVIENLLQENYKHIFILSPKTKVADQVIEHLSEIVNINDATIVKIEKYNDNESLTFASKSMAESLKAQDPLKTKNALLILDTGKYIKDIIDTFISEQVDMTSVKIFGTNQYDKFAEIDNEVLKGILFAEFKHNDYEEILRGLNNNQIVNNNIISGFELSLLIPQLISYLENGNTNLNELKISVFDNNMHIFDIKNNVFIRKGEDRGVTELQ